MYGSWYVFIDYLAHRQSSLTFFLLWKVRESTATFRVGNRTTEGIPSITYLLIIWLIIAHFTFYMPREGTREDAFHARYKGIAPF